MNLLNPYRWESGQGLMGYFNHKINQFSINPSDRASLANRQASAFVPTCPRTYLDITALRLKLFFRTSWQISEEAMKRVCHGAKQMFVKLSYSTATKQFPEIKKKRSHSLLAVAIFLAYCDETDFLPVCAPRLLASDISHIVGTRRERTVYVHILTSGFGIQASIPITEVSDYSKSRNVI